ncbi:MAG: alpha/beta hydrolase [Steroidobacter sp.]
MLTSLLNVLALLAVVFGVLCAIVYWRQDSLMFFPAPNDPMLSLRQQANRVQIPGPAGLLEGWWIANERATHPAVILYFGGNAEDVLYTAMTAPIFNAQRMLVVNYRGYGRSHGKPGQKALYEDALAVYDYATRSAAVKPEHIVVMGRSLGAGVAAMLASERHVAGAILITPFDSMAAVAAHHYSFLPVRVLLRHPFPSIDWARQAKAPALIVAAERDTIIPPVHAQRLHDAWTAEKQIHILEGVGHNDIELHTEYYQIVNEFLMEAVSG